MRDSDRIDTVVEALRAAWKRHPDARLGQLICGMAASTSAVDPFYIEDDVWHIEDDVWLRILTVPEASEQ